MDIAIKETVKYSRSAFTDGIMAFELFRRTKASESQDINAAPRELYQNLGFDMLAAPRVHPRFLYPKLGEAEWQIWSLFAPTKYSKKKGHWGKYDFGPIPIEALEEIKFAITACKFEDIWLLTEEPRNEEVIIRRRLQCPVAIGLDPNGDKYLLCRWGAALKPLPEILWDVLDKYGRAIFRWHCGRRMISLSTSVDPRRRVPRHYPLHGPLPDEQNSDSSRRLIYCGQCGYSIVRTVQYVDV